MTGGCFVNKILAEEFDRAVHNPRLWLALLLEFAFLTYGVTRAYEKDWVPVGFSFADMWYFVYASSYFPYIIPLAAALPFADSLVVDHSEGFLRYLVVRSKYRQYFTAKFIANAIVGALVIFIPLVGLYFFTNLIAPRAIYPVNVWQPQISGRPYGILMPLFQSNPDGFIVLVSLLAVLIGSLYSNFGLAVSLILPNRYLAWGTPCVVYLLSDFVAQRTHLFGPAWSPVAAAAGSLSIVNQSIQNFFLNPLGIVCLTLGIILLFGQRRRILQ
jgi:hypothetical protein